MEFLHKNVVPVFCHINDDLKKIEGGKNELEKATRGNSVEEFVFEKTGKSIAQIIHMVPEYRIYRLDEVKNALFEAKLRNMLVTLVSDFDDDGIQSTLIMTYIFAAMGLKYQLIIPKRFSEGYGLSMKIIERVPNGGLLVTIDNGIKAIEPIAEAKRKGMKVIIMDHHEAGAKLPAADIIVDPKAVGEADYTEYCGAGIAYKLAEEIFGKDHPIMKKLSCFAAIGTIGDSVEISEDNRKIVIDGLENMKYGKGSEGLKMLLEAQKFSEGSTATDVAFNIVPVLNACGRLKDDGAKMGVVALIDGGREKREKVNELLELNDLRKKLVEEAVSRLDLYAMAVSKDRSIFVVDNQIPLGIVGIVAGKISEYTGKPAFVLAKDETTGFYKGSARSKSNDYSLAGLMEAHAELFVGFGGHLKAAGLTMKEKNIMVFKNAIEKELPDVIFDDAIPYDIEILEADFPMVAAQILSLEPFGEGNPAPVIRLQMTVDNYSIIGKNKDTLKFTGFGYEAIMFHAKEQISMLPKHVSVIDLIGKVGVNVFRGNITTQINITDFVVLR